MHVTAKAGERHQPITVHDQQVFVPSNIARLFGAAESCEPRVIDGLLVTKVNVRDGTPQHSRNAEIWRIEAGTVPNIGADKAFRVDSGTIEIFCASPGVTVVNKNGQALLIHQGQKITLKSGDIFTISSDAPRSFAIVNDNGRLSVAEAILTAPYPTLPSMPRSTDFFNRSRDTSSASLRSTIWKESISSRGYARSKLG